jgi:hypothetical protein
VKPIGPGDVVVAVRDGGYDTAGRPVQRPERGKTYRIESVYEMRYGLGCTLVGMDPSPYRGYFLHVRKRSRSFEAGWYFERIESADSEFTKTLREYIGSKNYDTVT